MTIVALAGPTGAGKTELAIRLAERFGAEIVNYDSVQLYRGFDIGSAKPSLQARGRVRHHLFDVLDADQEFTAADYARLARPVCQSIRMPLLAGGTFFYLRALLSGLPEMPARDLGIRARIRRVTERRGGAARLHRFLSRVDPASALRIATGDRHRIERAIEVWLISGRPISSFERDGGEELPALKIALSIDRAELNRHLDQRVEEMYRAGLLDETRGLVERYASSARPFEAIGYREAVALLAGQISSHEAIAETKRRTRAYAKRQMTWLRSERNMHWIDAADREKAFAAAAQLIEEKS